MVIVVGDCKQESMHINLLIFLFVLAVRLRDLMNREQKHGNPSSSSSSFLSHLQYGIDFFSGTI